MKTLQHQTRGEKKPAKTAFEVKGTSRMDFRKVNSLLRPTAPESYKKHKLIRGRTIYQEGAEL